MKKVLLQGAFDLLNYGHVKAFEDAKKQGDYLIIALNTDNLIRKYKKREPILPYWQRKIILESIRWIDKVVPAKEFSCLELLKKNNIDVYVVADEWKKENAKEIKYMISKGGRIFFVFDYYRVIHSSEMRMRCAKQILTKLLKDYGKK